MGIWRDQVGPIERMSSKPRGWRWFEEALGQGTGMRAEMVLGRSCQPFDLLEGPNNAARDANLQSDKH
jgi:hypothetical protein